MNVGNHRMIVTITAKLWFVPYSEDIYEKSQFA